MIDLPGAVPHGFIGEPFPALGISDPTYQDWLDSYAQSLQTTGGYDLGIAFHWEKLADNAKTKPDMYTQDVEYSKYGITRAVNDVLTPGQNTVVAAGAAMLADVERDTAVLPVGQNDVVDVNFIGWSRGGDAVSQALQDMNADTNLSPHLQAGYMMMTTVDPHPANNIISDFSSIFPLALPIIACSIRSRLTAGIPHMTASIARRSIVRRAMSSAEKFCAGAVLARPNTANNSAPTIILCFAITSIPPSPVRACL